MFNQKQHVVHLTTEELKEIIDERLKAFREESKSPNQKEKDKFPELLTRQEVADVFDVSFVTLHNWVKHGLLPKPIKKGKMVYFLRKEIIESIKSRNNHGE